MEALASAVAGMEAGVRVMDGVPATDGCLLPLAPLLLVPTTTTLATITMVLAPTIMVLARIMDPVPTTVRIINPTKAIFFACAVPRRRDATGAFLFSRRAILWRS